MASEADLIKIAFKDALPDSSSTMTRKQMAAILRTLDQGLTEEGIQNLLSYVDKNNNGTIEYNEFVDFICELDPTAIVEDVPTESRAEKNQATTIGNGEGVVFDTSRWQKALSGGAWAFACDQQASAMRMIVQQFPDLEPLSPEGLTLAEEFVLLWHDRQSGELKEYSFFGSDEPFHNALFGACLLGLQARKCLSFTDRKGKFMGNEYRMELSDNAPDDSEVLKSVHEELKQKPYFTLKMWFEEKSGKWGQDRSTQLTLEALVKRDILEKVGGPDALSNAMFKVKDNSVEEKLMTRLRDIVNGKVEPDGRSVALLALCRTADLRDPSTNTLMKQMFPDGVEQMTVLVDKLVDKIVSFNGIGTEEINRMIDVLPGKLQQELGSQAFRDKAAAQFKELSGGTSKIVPAKLAKESREKCIGALVSDKLGIKPEGMESVIKMFDRDQDGDLEEEGFISFLMWCRALEALA